MVPSSIPDSYGSPPCVIRKYYQYTRKQGRFQSKRFRAHGIEQKTQNSRLTNFVYYNRIVIRLDKEYTSNAL